MWGKYNIEDFEDIDNYNIETNTLSSQFTDIMNIPGYRVEMKTKEKILLILSFLNEASPLRIAAQIEFEEGEISKHTRGVVRNILCKLFKDKKISKKFIEKQVYYSTKEEFKDICEELAPKESYNVPKELLIFNELNYIKKYNIIAIEEISSYKQTKDKYFKNILLRTISSLILKKSLTTIDDILKFISAEEIVDGFYFEDNYLKLKNFVLNLPEEFYNRAGQIHKDLNKEILLFQEENNELITKIRKLENYNTKWTIPQKVQFVIKSLGKVSAKTIRNQIIFEDELEQEPRALYGNIYSALKNLNDMGVISTISVDGISLYFEIEKNDTTILPSRFERKKSIYENSSKLPGTYPKNRHIKEKIEYILSFPIKPWTARDITIQYLVEEDIEFTGKDDFIIHHRKIVNGLNYLLKDKIIIMDRTNKKSYVLISNVNS